MIWCCDVIWCDVVILWCDVTWCDDVTRCDITSHHVMWCDVMSRDVTMWYEWDVTWCVVMLCDVAWRHMFWCDETWCDELWCVVLWCDPMWWCDVDSYCKIITCIYYKTAYWSVAYLKATTSSCRLYSKTKRWPKFIAYCNFFLHTCNLYYYSQHV